MKNADVEGWFDKYETLMKPVVLALVEGTEVVMNNDL